MRAAALLLICAMALPAAAQVINPPPGNQQDLDTTEWRGWVGATLDWKPVKAVHISLDQQWRWDNDFRDFDRQFQQFGVSWSPRWNKWSKAQYLGLGLRHSSRPDRKGAIQGTDRYLRMQYEYGFEWETGRWTCGGRLRHQRQRALALKGGEDPGEYTMLVQTRLKGELAYNIKGWKWDPVLSVERFWVDVPEGWLPDGARRFRLGTARKLGKQHRVKLFIQRDAEARYNPAETGIPLSAIGAGIDDLRLNGRVEWTAGVSWRYRFKKPKRD